MAAINLSSKQTPHTFLLQNQSSNHGHRGFNVHFLSTHHFSGSIKKNGIDIWEKMNFVFSLYSGRKGTHLAYYTPWGRRQGLDPLHQILLQYIYMHWSSLSMSGNDCFIIYSMYTACHTACIQHVIPQRVP